MRSNGTVNAFGQIELLRQAMERGDGTGRDLRDLYRHLFLLVMKFQDVIDTAEMSEDSNGRLTVLAERFDDTVVLDAARLVGLKGGQQLRLYTDRAGSALTNTLAVKVIHQIDFIVLINSR